MSNNSNNRMIVFASILGAILATGLLALNPSPMIKNAGAQLYANEYGYDNSYNNNYYQEPKSSHTDIQKIKCVNSNINVNGIDITQIPQDNTALGAANEGGAADAANTQNGNGLEDRINFEKNLVNICVNVNDNEQVKVTPPPEQEETCEDCFTDNLNSEQEQFFMANSGLGGTFTETCQFLQENPNGPAESGTVVLTLQGLPGITPEQVTSTVDCLVGFGLLEPTEICNNGIDDDDDNLLDCEDQDCLGDPSCL
jgi:hypothetical protein